MVLGKKGNIEWLMGICDTLDGWKDPVLNRIIRVDFIEKVKLKQRLSEWHSEPRDGAGGTYSK